MFLKKLKFQEASLRAKHLQMDLETVGWSLGLWIETSKNLRSSRWSSRNHSLTIRLWWNFCHFSRRSVDRRYIWKVCLYVSKSQSVLIRIISEVFKSTTRQSTYKYSKECMIPLCGRALSSWKQTSQISNHWRSFPHSKDIVRLIQTASIQFSRSRT